MVLHCLKDNQCTINRSNDVCVPGGDGLSRMGGSSSSIIPGRSVGYHLNIGRRKFTDDDEYGRLVPVI